MKAAHRPPAFPAARCIGWLVCLLFTACSDETALQEVPLAEHPAAPAAASMVEALPDFSNLQQMTFDEFERRVSRLSGKKERYIVNGDTLIIGRRNLEAFFNELKKREDGAVGGKLLINRIGAGPGFGGRADMWDSVRRRNLTYCVSREFGQHYDSVSSAMAMASEEWERYADVNFIHSANDDGHCSNDVEGIVFTVAPEEMSPNTVAIAPFPSYSRADQVLQVNPKVLPLNPNLGYDMVGLMRHELGHVLGFHHEQSRPEAGICFYPTDGLAATRYDPRSVMHYPECAGTAGSTGFALSELDKQGVACLYGPGPDSGDLIGCQYQASISAATGRQIEERLIEERVETGKWNHYGPYDVEPSSIATIDLLGSRTGDPDLYLRYVGRPTLRESICNPRLPEDESCRVQLPTGVRTLYIGVYGVQAAAYTLQVSYVQSRPGGNL